MDELIKSEEYNYVKAIENYFNLDLFNYQRIMLTKMLERTKQEEKIYPYFIRPRQSSMKYFYEFLRQFYGIKYHTELIKMDINKIYGDETNQWIMEE